MDAPIGLFILWGNSFHLNYLKLLIESAGLNIKLPANNTISNLPRDEKKNRAEKFVFRIEVLK